MGDGALRGLASTLMVAERRGRLSRTNGSCLPSVGLTAELGGALGGDRDLMSEGLAKVLLIESLRKRPVPRSAWGSGMLSCGCAKRPATAVLVRRACAATGISLSSSSSKTGAGPNFLNGYVEAEPGGALVGDWEKKYESIGELPGDTGPIRTGLVEVEIGVGISVGEFDEPDDEEDTEAERPRRVTIGIGFECMVESVELTLEDIVE